MFKGACAGYLRILNGVIKNSQIVGKPQQAIKQAVKETLALGYDAFIVAKRPFEASGAVLVVVPNGSGGRYSKM